MSRADAADRITAAAVSLGVERGMGALSLQAIAGAAGVSKALVLYHFDGKAELLDAVTARLARTSEARLRRAIQSEDVMTSWRALARDEAGRGELALLAALALESVVAAEPLLAARAGREEAAATLALAVLDAVGLTPRVPALFLGRLLLRQLDGLVVAATRGGLPASALDAELDAFALALLALGR